MRRSSFLVLLILLVATIVGLNVQVKAQTADTSGYSVTSNKVIINSPNHWKKWSFPAGTVNIANDGTISPTYIRKNINACLDAGNFKHKDPATDKEVTGGIRNVGSNKADAPKVMDGDPNTYWEPDYKDPSLNWWIEIDLGRFVVATKIVLKFVEEGKGDPFRQFRVFAADGERAFLGSKSLKYNLVGKTTKPNDDQRLFEYEFNITPVGAYAFAPIFTSKRTNLTWTGDGFQYVKIQITDRKEGLHPRLAEVEVWAVGDNIALGTVARGGMVDECGIGGAGKATDGDFMSDWDAYAWSPFRPRGRMVIDLATQFWIDSYRLCSWRNPASGQGAFYGFRIRGSDGSQALGGGETYPCGTFPQSLIWQSLSPDEREIFNIIQVLMWEDHFAPRKVRYLDMRNIDQTGSYQGAYGALGLGSEFQLYGEGFVPETTLTSPIIEMGASRNLLSIDWDANASPNTKFEIRTRTGDQLNTIKHWYDNSGKELTEAAYNKLPGFRKGPITEEQKPGSDWSNWSQTYLKPGDAITSPSPRKYLMIEVQLLSDDPKIFASVKSVTLNFVAPVADAVTGQLSPSTAKSAVKQFFSLFLRPTFSSGNRGFNEIRVMSPSGVEMEFLKARIGNTELTGTKLMSTAKDTMWVRLPSVVGLGTTDPVEIQFASAIYLNGSLFRASVGNSGIPNSWQRVDPATSQAMTIAIPLTGKIIGDITIEPEQAFTPNGDGINDVAKIKFTVFKINIEREVRVRIFDLSGRLLRKVYEEKTLSGIHEDVAWDGKDDEGTLVPPGIYICQIDIDADSGENVVRKIITVAY